MFQLLLSFKYFAGVIPTSYVHVSTVLYFPNVGDWKIQTWYVAVAKINTNIIEICQGVDKVNYANWEAWWPYIGILLIGFIQWMDINVEWSWDVVDIWKNFVQKREFEVQVQSAWRKYLCRREVIYLNVYIGINNRSNYLAWN